MGGGHAKRFLALGAGAALVLMAVGSASASPAGASVPGREVYMPTRGMAEKAAHAARPVKSANLKYHGGNPGVLTGNHKVYLIAWGSQWNNNDPQAEVVLLEDFFNHVGGSGWNGSVTQYCDGIANGAVSCGSSGNHATNPGNLLGAPTWYDSGSAAPSHPSQSQLAAEAARAAAYFGNPDHTQVQYVILTATGNGASGAGTQYCAWHSSTSSGAGTIAYTNMPYVTDFGSSCGANFNGMGPKAGITMVEGHEFAETETDIYPNGGWLDGSGAENADKCAWISSGQGASASVGLNGKSFPVQSLWSNSFNSGRGGCVNG